MIKKLVCENCRCEFRGFHTRMYCDECRDAFRKNASKRARERKKMGATRSLGTVDTCENCGGQYIVAGGLQKYCKDCKDSIYKEHDRIGGMKYYTVNKDVINPKRNKERHELYIENRYCIICAKKLKIVIGGKKTCSQECAKIHKNKMWLEQSRRKKIK